MAKLESVLHFLENTFHSKDFPDYPYAFNGLQVEGPLELSHVGVAVDASEETLLEARNRGVDFLVVHHGLFWDGPGPLTGPRYRKVSALMEGGMALYSLHLPLDAHPTLGNCSILARALGLEVEGGFAAFEGEDVGCWGRAQVGRDTLKAELAKIVDGPVHVVPGGPENLRKIGVLTGGGASAIGEAADKGLDALVTGEVAHHHYHETMERGLNLFLGGHYATETFGVKAVGELIGREFDVPCTFLHFPTGL